MEEKIKVLIIDDDPDWKHDLQKNVSRWGYEPIVADDAGYDLIDKALYLNNLNCCHIALVDMNLFDYSTGDDSGLELSKSLLPTIPIGISGLPLMEFMIKTLKDSNIPIKVFWAKANGPDELKEILETAIKEEWEVHEEKMGNVDWPYNLSPSNLTAKFNKKFVICPSELEWLIVKHFKNMHHIKLDQLDNGNHTNNYSSAIRGKSTIFKATITESLENEIITNIPSLIKIARKERILKEQRNFEKYIRNKLFFHNAAPIKRTTLMWKMGIVEYEFLPEMRNRETSRSTFAEFYSQSSIKIKDIAISVSKIEQMLSSLYTIWHPLLQNKKIQETTLFQEFDKVWKSDDSDINDSLEKKLRTFKIKSKHIQILEEKIEILNPIAWILKRIDSKKIIDQSPSKFSTYLAITHGDMHGDNILVEEGYDPIFIDFERSGYGPIFQDFVLLEVDLLIRIGNFSNMQESLQLFISFLENYRLENPPTIASFDNGEIYKAWRSISKIRELSFTYADNKFVNYLWGLLLNIALRCVLIQKQIDQKDRTENIEREKVQLQRALLYGGLICYKLESPRSNWIPKNLTETANIEPVEFNNTITDLYDLICKHFNIDEFEELLFRINAKDEPALQKSNLPGDTFHTKVREYIFYMRRRNRLHEVLKYCLKERPQIKWPLL